MSEIITCGFDGDVISPDMFAQYIENISEESATGVVPETTNWSRSGNIITLGPNVVLFWKGRLIVTSQQLSLPLVNTTETNFCVCEIDLSKQNESTGTLGLGDYLCINNQVSFKIITGTPTENQVVLFQIVPGSNMLSGGQILAQKNIMYDNVSTQPYYVGNLICNEEIKSMYRVCFGNYAIPTTPAYSFSTIQLVALGAGTEIFPTGAQLLLQVDNAHGNFIFPFSGSLDIAPNLTTSQQKVTGNLRFDKSTNIVYFDFVNQSDQPFTGAKIRGWMEFCYDV